MIDATYLNAQRMAFSLGLKGDLVRPIGRIRGGMNAKIHAPADPNDRPLSFFMTAG